MPRKIEDIAAQLAQAVDPDHRRKVAAELRDAGFANRFSLEKRGSLATPAETDLGPDQLEALANAVSDEDHEVRRAAIMSAGDLGDASCVPALVDQLTDDDDEIRLAAINALGEIGGEQSTKALAGLARQPDEKADVRLAALTELEQLTTKAITFGPDRHFDPPEDSATGAALHLELEGAKGQLLDAVTSIQADSVADEFLKLKAHDIQTYLESGLG